MIGARRAPPGLPLRHCVEAVVGAALLPPALELFSAARVLAAVERLPARRAASAEPRVLARAVDALLRRLPWIWHHSCLRRAVVLAALLRRDGRAAVVRLGVRRAASGELEAHAWLRCDGIEPYLENGPASEFTPLESATR